MIILRQNEYSWKTKALYRLRALGNKVKVLGADTEAAITDMTHGKHSIDSVNAKARASKARKSKRELMKQSILDKDKIHEYIKKKVVEPVKKTTEYVNTHTPGDLAADIPEKILDKGLVASTGTVAGYVPLLAGVYVPGTTAVSVGAEAALRKKFPGYTKWSEKNASTYRKGKLRRLIKNTGDAVANIPIG